MALGWSKVWRKVCCKLAFCRRVGVALRNDWVHNGKKSHVSDVVWWSRNYVNELLKAGCMGISGNVRLDKGKEVRGDRWRPPDQGMLKINCNTNFDKGKRIIGFGSIIRDAKGRVVAYCSQVCEANFDVDTSKAMTVWKGISFGIDCGFDRFVVETNLDTVINNIVKGGNSDSRYGCILDSVAALVSAPKTVTFLSASRNANRVAGILANKALRVSDKVIWREDAPMAIRSLVESERQG